MPKEGSVAPKERVNITYKSATSGQPEVELPLKMLVLGDFTGRPDDTPLEERKVVNVDKDNFNEVMEKQKLAVDINVANKLTDDADAGDLGMHLDFRTLKDFTPDGIVNQVPELSKLLELRKALVALKSPLGNKKAFRKRIQQILRDENARAQIMKELNIGNAG